MAPNAARLRRPESRHIPQRSRLPTNVQSSLVHFACRIQSTGEGDRGGAARKGRRSMNSSQESRHDARQRRAIVWGAASVLGLVLAAFITIWMIGFYNVWEPQLIEDHFAAVVGLPAAALAASCIILVFRQTAGPIEFELLGLKLRGAAGPVVLWTLCFLAIAASIKMLW
jgi:hypothetical protein